jgi:hypothetical protein
MYCFDSNGNLTADNNNQQTMEMDHAHGEEEVHRAVVIDIARLTDPLYVARSGTR